MIPTHTKTDNHSLIFPDLFAALSYAWLWYWQFHRSKLFPLKLIFDLMKKKNLLSHVKQQQWQLCYEVFGPAPNTGDHSQVYFTVKNSSFKSQHHICTQNQCVTADVVVEHIWMMIWLAILCTGACISLCTTVCVYWTSNMQLLSKELILIYRETLYLLLHKVLIQTVCQVCVHIANK